MSVPAQLHGTSKSAHLLVNVGNNVELGPLLVARDFDEVALNNEGRDVEPGLFVHLQHDAE
jgi:hypothetical protein